MPLLLALLAGSTVAFLVIGVGRARTAGRRPSIQGRVDRLRERRVEAGDPYEASFAVRVLQPIRRKLVATVTAVLPAHMAAGLREALLRAGLTVSVSTYVMIWVALATLLPLFLTVSSLLSGSISVKLLIAIVVWVGAGAYLPWFWLRRKASRRTQQIDRALPDAIDIIVTGLEAGLSLQSSMLTLAARQEGPLGHDLRRMSRETSLGRARAEALLAMAERSGSREMRLLVRAIIQAEQMGLSIAPVLRNQARDVRLRRQQYAREQAGKVPVKITIPTVLFIFPTLFMLLITPVALNVIDSFKNQ